MFAIPASDYSFESVHVLIVDDLLVQLAKLDIFPAFEDVCYCVVTIVRTCLVIYALGDAGIKEASFWGIATLLTGLKSKKHHNQN